MTDSKQSWLINYISDKWKIVLFCFCLNYPPLNFTQITVHLLNFNPLFRTHLHNKIHVMRTCCNLAAFAEWISLAVEKQGSVRCILMTRHWSHWIKVGIKGLFRMQVHLCSGSNYPHYSNDAEEVEQPFHISQAFCFSAACRPSAWLSQRSQRPDSALLLLLLFFLFLFFYYRVALRPRSVLQTDWQQLVSLLIK